MAAAVASQSHGGSVARSPVVARSCASTRVRVSVNPACVARPEDDEAAKDAKRRQCTRHRRDEERSRSRSPDRKRNRRDDARGGMSPDRRRKRESFSRADNGRRGGSPSSRSSCRRTRPGASSPATTGADDAHARRAAWYYQDGERAQEARRRSRSRSEPRPSPRARPDPCGAAQQQQLPAPAIAPPRVAGLDGWPQQEWEEQFEEAEWRRRETQRKREAARREMDRVVQTVYFNDPFLSPFGALKR